MYRNQVPVTGSFVPSCETNGIGVHDIPTYNTAINTKANRLFVAQEESCKVEVREYLKNERDETHDRSPGTTLPEPYSVTTLDGLKITLDVFNFSFESVPKY